VSADAAQRNSSVGADEVPADALTVGVDVGGTKIAAGVVDGTGKLLAHTRRETPAQDTRGVLSGIADAVREQFTERAMPVFAYLDIGIYGHPIYDGKTPGVKIGFYHPPDATVVKSKINSVEDFVAECMPGLREAATVDVAEASGVDTCFYDLVGDDDFVLGPVPDASGVFVGVGWRGTGYKFAPWVGRVLAQLALTHGTVYDISRFAPSRFARGIQTGGTA